MKEFIEKLIARLEEHSFSLVINWEKGKYLRKDKVIDIINELSEECNNDFCEWKASKNFDWFFKSPHKGVGTIKEESDLFKFCPYCGKKIKVVK